MKPRKTQSRTNLNLSVAGIEKPFGNSEPPAPSPKEDQGLMAEVAAAEEMLKAGKSISPTALGRLLAKCTLALAPCGPGGGVDQAKMVAVWEVLIELMNDMLNTVDKNVASNKTQAADNKATRDAVEKMMHASTLNRWISGATTIAMLACMVLISNWSRETLETARSAKAMLSTTLNATSLDTEARVAMAKAEDDFELKEADRKAIKAEAALARAQQTVAPTPAIRAQAIVKLQAVKRRAVKMKVQIDDSPLQTH